MLQCNNTQMLRKGDDIMQAKSTQAAPCQFCEGVPERDKCARCKKIYKEEMADIIKGLETIYISERNKGGRKKVNISRDVLWQYRVYGYSCRRIAEMYKVSAQTISRLCRKYGL